MTSEQFAFWLQGWMELENPQEMTKEQVDTVKRHLALVFKYEIDPSYTSDPQIQQELQNIHDGTQGTKEDDNIQYRC
jgi:hypothetical protein